MILAMCFAPVSLILIHSDPSITVSLSLAPLSLILLQISLSLSVSGWSNVDIPAVNCSWPSNCRLMARWKGKSRMKLNWNRKLELSAEPRDTHSEACCTSATVCGSVPQQELWFMCACHCGPFRTSKVRILTPPRPAILLVIFMASQDRQHVCIYICLYVYISALILAYMCPGTFRARASAIFD